MSVFCEYEDYSMKASSKQEKNEKRPLAARDNLPMSAKGRGGSPSRRVGVTGGSLYFIVKGGRSA